ncbi:MAG: nucleotidyltransferase domain-containing protein [Chloroflexota bacterium]
MTTALDLTPEQIQRYARSARKRAAPPPLSPDELADYQALLQRILQAAELLKTRFHARRVILFGSLAHQAWFRRDSDVDLAVEGLQGGDYMRAWAQVEQTIGDRQVDLIDIEAVSPSLRKAIERYGKVL